MLTVDLVRLIDIGDILIIYVCIKAALQQFGEFTMVTTERAFKDKAKAEEYIKSVPVVWEETISGVMYKCERAVHEVELE